MHIYKNVLLGLGLGILLLSSSTVYAADEELDCALLIVTKDKFTFTGQNNPPTIALTKNERMYVIWLSSGTLTGEREDKAKISTSGLTLLTPTEDKTLTYTFTDKRDSVSCEAKVRTPLTSTSVSAGINKKDPSTLVIKPIALLGGGTVTANETIPVMYLQITNTGTTTAQMSTLTLRQAGSADVESFKSFSVVDDADNVYINATDAMPEFDGKDITLPVKLMLGAGQTRLLTIRTTLEAKSTIVVGTTVRLNATEAEMLARKRVSCPINGVIWSIKN